MSRPHPLRVADFKWQTIQNDLPSLKQQVSAAQI